MAQPAADTSPGVTGSASQSAVAARPALWVFATVEVAAFAYYLALARTQWFFLDEWDFLAGRGMNLHDLLRSHGGHLVAAPVVVYRFLWLTVGLRSYLPYAVLPIVLHLTAAGLLRTIMRRSGVRPWTATIAASVFALLGSGAQDILWAFQITFSGALVFGLVHFLLADHEGSFDRRDLMGVVAGLLALMCSGVAVTMVIVVGGATLARRGWRIAALHTVPLGVLYVAWWARYGGDASSFSSSVREIWRWCTSGLAGLIDALGQNRGVAWVLVALLIACVVLTVRSGERRELLVRARAPLALLAGVPIFLLITGVDRSGVGGAAGARSGRYVHILAALALPAIAIVLDAMWQRSRALGVVGLAVLLIGVPGNVADARSYARRQESRSAATRHLMLSVPRLPLARVVPRTLRPDPSAAEDVTVGWLRAGVDSGRIPRGPRPSALALRTYTLRLSLLELDRPSGIACRPLRSPVTLRLAKETKFGVRGTISVVAASGTRRSTPVYFGTVFPNTALDHTLVATAGPLVLRVAPAGSGASLCLSPG